MTTTAPSTVDWIRFDTLLGESIRSDSGELWRLDLSVDREESDDPPFVLGTRLQVSPTVRATLGLVLPNRKALLPAEAEILRLRAFLHPLDSFGVEAAITVPASPYNRLELPRVSPVDFTLTPRMAADGKTALTFLVAEVHPVASGRYMRMSQAA